MPSVGRNDPCACGSGKKYKKCCLAREQEVASARLRHAHDLAANREDEQREIEARRKIEQALARGARLVLDDDRLDDLSNSVLDLIAERRFDEALLVCQRLIDDHPDVEDGFERSALVHEAMGNYELAADFWRRAVAFVEAPSRRAGFSPELIDDYRQRCDNAKRRAAEGQPARTAEDDRAP